MTPNPIRERRRYARVDDDIVLFWREVASEEIPDGFFRKIDLGAQFPLSSQLKLLSLETGELLRRIAQKDPLLAEYLRALERKIDVIARALAASETSSLCHGTQHVNLSAAGMAFIANKAFPRGVLLELKMILPPSLTGIIAYGRVVDSIPNHGTGSTSFSMGVDFIHLSERDRELLARHVDRRRMLFRQ